MLLKYLPLIILVSVVGVGFANVTTGPGVYDDFGSSVVVLVLTVPPIPKTPPVFTFDPPNCLELTASSVTGWASFDNITPAEKT